MFAIFKFANYLGMIYHVIMDLLDGLFYCDACSHFLLNQWFTVTRFTETGGVLRTLLPVGMT